MTQLLDFKPGTEPICPKCGEPAESRGMGSRTLMAGNSGYDDDGNYHNHDPNWSTSTLNCPNGHSWSKKSRKACQVNGCDFGGETLFICDGKKYDRNGEPTDTDN